MQMSPLSSLNPFVAFALVLYVMGAVGGSRLGAPSLIEPASVC